MKKNSLTTARLIGASVAGLAIAAASASAQTLVADYEFNGDLTSSVAGAPALTATDPLSMNSFGTANVLGNPTHGVYNYVGNTDPASQAGLTLNSTGLVSPNNYSINLVASINNLQGDGSGWVRLIDVQNRQSDNGFYSDPSHLLDLYPVAAGGNTVAQGVFEDFLLTVAPDGTVDAYLNGHLSFTTTSTEMNIDNADNPGNLINFFLDNTQAGGLGEFSSGIVAQIQLYSGVVSAPDAGSSMALMGLAFTALAGFGLKSRKQ